MNHFDAVRDLLETNGLDAMLVTSRYNRIFTSGIQCSFGAVLVSKRNRWYFTDSRFGESATKALGAEHVRIVTALSLYTELGLLMKDEGITRLGIEEDYLTCREERELLSNTDAELCPAQNILVSMRAVKMPEDLCAMQKAQRLTEEAYYYVLELIQPGISERDIAAELISYMIRHGASGTSFNPIIAAGARSSLPHGAPTDYCVKAGDFLTMDFGFVVDGWCSDMTRTVAIGHATDEMKLIYEAVLQAQEAGISKARAGVLGCEIDAAGREVIRAAGFGDYFCHGFGHGMGIEGHESPGASPNDRTPLPAGAVISAEPGIYIPGRMGVRIEDIIYITEEGHVNLNRAQKSLLIL